MKIEKQKKNVKLELRLKSKDLWVNTQLFFKYLFVSIKYFFKMLLYSFVILGLAMFAFGELAKKEIDKSKKKNKSSKTLKLKKDNNEFFKL